MKKLLIFLTLILSFTFVKAQNPVNITQPYNFLKWIKVKDSIRCTIYFQNANDTLATKKQYRDFMVSMLSRSVLKSDSGSLFLTPYQTNILLNGKISLADSLTKYVTKYQLSLKQDKIITGTTLQYFRGDLSLATFPDINWKTENFDESAYGYSGQINTLSNTPKSSTSIQVQLNGNPLKSTQYIRSTNTVKINIPVRQYDVTTISYQY